MPITYPTTLDALDNPEAADSLNSPSHSQQHSDANDAIEALEAKVGVDSSTVKTTQDYKIARLQDGIYNVLSYGAIGDGTTDDTAAIQSAIDAASTAGGGTVFFPKGTYKVTSLTLKSYVNLKGVDGAWNTAKGSIIKTAATTGDVLSYSATAGLFSVTISELRIEGAGSGTGNGIRLQNAGGTTKPNVNIVLRNVKVVNFTGGAGVELQCTIVSVLDNVTCETCDTGFYLNGGAAFASVNTSLTVLACYANGCTTYGFNIRSTVYSNFSGCAADDCGTAYLMDNLNSVTLTSCGSEWANPTTASPADGFKITGSRQVTLVNPYTFQNKHYSWWVTGNSEGITLIAPQENTPNSPTNSIKVDAGSHVALINQGTTTATSLQGDTSTLDDGSGGLVTGSYGYINGALTAIGLTTLNDGLIVPIAAVGVDHTITGSEQVLLGDSTGGAFAFTLPTAVGRQGQVYTIKRLNAGTNDITIQTTSAQTIDGATSYILTTRYESLTVISDGANWDII